MFGKILEALILLLGLLVTAAIVIKIPLDSYNAHKDYLAQIEEANKPEIKAELVSIDVKLNEGVRYFANDVAEAKPEHFTVTAHFVKGEEEYSEIVEIGKYTVTAPSDFYANGGDVVIKFRTQSVTMNFQLEPVLMEALEIVQNPYTVHYAQGTSFDAAGMIVKGIYNDGSTKILDASEYDVDTSSALGLSDKEVKVSYKVGEDIISAGVKINVTETVNNGQVASLIIVGNPIVNAGSSITTAAIEVNAVYESGNRKLLTADEYTISGSTEATKFGKAYTLTVTYNADSTKTASAKAIIRHTVQGESGTIVGGKVKTETEYFISGGTITKSDHDVTFAGDFSKVVTNGAEGSVSFVINSETRSVGNITMRCGNSYLVGAKGNYSMKPLQINTILDLTINGKEVQIPANVVLKGCGPYTDYAPLYGIYYEFTFENVQLDPGANLIKFSFKKSTVGALNCWGESPSTMNIDYLHFDTIGNEIPDNYNIESLVIADSFKAEYKQSFESLNVPVTAVITGGSTIAISPDEYTVNIIGAKEGETYFKFRTYTIEVALKSNPEIKTSYEFTIEEFKSFAVLNAYVEVEGNKVYYVLTGDCTGYEADDFVLFDGTTKYPIIATFGEDTFVFKYDATAMKIGEKLYPHITVEGVNYANGSNTSGDVMGNGLTFVDGQTVKFDGKRYSIKGLYSMPVLEVDEIVSEKDLFGKYVYGSAGVTTNGSDKNADYSGGIGNMDGKGKYVTYTFTLTEAGTVDFVWYVAGSKWNGSGNDGIEDMSKYMTITIDGKSVTVPNMALPKGDGATSDEWWNIQKVIFADIQLGAGTHTFTCTITGSGGLNIGAMEIYFAAN